MHALIGMIVAGVFPNLPITPGLFAFDMILQLCLQQYDYLLIIVKEYDCSSLPVLAFLWRHQNFIHNGERFWLGSDCRHVRTRDKAQEYWTVCVCSEAKGKLHLQRCLDKTQCPSIESDAGNMHLMYMTYIKVRLTTYLHCVCTFIMNV